MQGEVQECRQHGRNLNVESRETNYDLIKNGKKSGLHKLTLVLPNLYCIL